MCSNIGDEYENVEAVCCVLATQRSRDVIDLTLSTFIPQFEQLDPDYASPPNDPNGTFATAQEMIDYFVLNETCEQAFFWNQPRDNPEQIMIGAFLTSDAQLIISLTLPADGKREHTYLEKLMRLLNSDTGVISYHDPPAFNDGADFINKYGT